MAQAKKFIAVYTISIGLFMLGFWFMLLVTNQVPSEQKPYSISFHLAGEFITAVLLVIAGLGIWLKKSWSNYLSTLALGLLLYTVVVSPGYYAQLGDMAMVTLFMALTFLTTLAIVTMFKNR